jgi:signal transduction histidine kinase
VTGVSRFATRALIPVVGATATAVAAMTAGMTAGDGIDLALLAGAGASIAGVAGAGALRLLRDRSVALQTVIVGLASVAATAAGAGLAANAMFVSPHDLSALVVVLIASGTVGILAAHTLGWRLAAATRLTAELEAAGARLETARAHEQALERSRRELVAWVSHDLRTPLAGIRAMAEALEDGVAADDLTVTRYHSAIRIQCERLAGLVDDLFELSRIEAAVLDLDVEPVALSELVSDVVAGATAVAKAKGVHLEGLMIDPVPVVDVSTAEMARVLRNLVENAIHHTPPDGAVRIEAGADDGAAYVSVRDACGGIPPDDLDRVFDLAFRGDAARSPGGSAGAGLGLAIARGLVEAHRGDIAVRNEPGGCRFTVRLPLTAP